MKLEILETDPDGAIVCCSADHECLRHRARLTIPLHMISNEAIKVAFRNTETETAYISPDGLPFCSRRCWSAYCSD